MITAVDTNILLGILIPEAAHGDTSEQAVTESLRAGATIISEVVYAELSAHLSIQEELDHFLEEAGILSQPSGPKSSTLRARRGSIIYAGGQVPWFARLVATRKTLIAPSVGHLSDRASGS